MEDQGRKALVFFWIQGPSAIHNLCQTALKFKLYLRICVNKYANSLASQYAFA